MSTRLVHDYLRSYLAQLDKRTQSYIERLIAAPADQHDANAGIIRGLAQARQIAIDHGKTFQAYIDQDDDADMSADAQLREFNRRQQPLPLV